MSQLIFDQLINDPLVKSSFDTIIDRMSELQNKIKEPKGPDSEHEATYKETIENFQKNRGGNLIFPYLSSNLGHRTFIQLADGSVKYDFIIGVGVHFFGHNHPGLTRAMLESALNDTVMQGNLQQNTNSAAFIDRLIKASRESGAKLNHCLLTSSGAMAGENAIKIAFQAKAPAKRFLSFKNCFMGRTNVMAWGTDNEKYRDGLPKIVDVDHIPFFDSNDPEGSTKLASDTLKGLLQKHPGEYAAMSFELILGEGGFYPGQKEFFIELMTICKSNNVAVLVDEVQSFARTSRLFAFQHFGLDEYVDIVWVGKASQVCATLYTSDIKPRPLLLSQTYTSSSTAIAAGNYILNELLTGNYYGPNGKIQKLHDHFVTGLKQLAEKHPSKVSGPYGVGAMIAFTPYGGDAEKVKSFMQRLYQNGVIALSCGKIPLRIRFLIPAGVITFEDIDNVLAIVDKTLSEEG